MLPRLVESYSIVLWWNPVKLIAEDICGRWLGLCRYADIDIGLAPLVKALPTQMSWKTKRLGLGRDSQDVWSVKTFVLANWNPGSDRLDD